MWQKRLKSVWVLSNRTRAHCNMILLVGGRLSAVLLAEIFILLEFASANMYSFNQLCPQFNMNSFSYPRDWDYISRLLILDILYNGGLLLDK